MLKHADLNSQIARGQAIGKIFRGGLNAANWGVNQAFGLGKRILKPTGGAAGKFIPTVGRFAMRHPALTTAGVMYPMIANSIQEKNPVLPQFNQALMEGQANSMADYMKTGSLGSGFRALLNKDLAPLTNINDLMGASAAKGGIEGLGKGLGDVAAKGISYLGQQGIGALNNIIFQQPQRNAILQQLTQEDDIIQRAMQDHPKDIMDAYQTMLRFAPTLTTDKNAVRSFLRSASTTGGNVDYVTIKNLADAERAVNGTKHASFNLRRYIKPEAVDKILHHGLNKLASASLKSDEPFTLEKTAQLMGQQLYQRRIEQTKIAEGLHALSNI